MVDSQEEKCIYLTKTDYCVCEEKNDGKKICNCTHLILAKPQDAQNYSDLLEMLEDQYAPHLANVCSPRVSLPGSLNQNTAGISWYHLEMLANLARVESN